MIDIVKNFPVSHPFLYALLLVFWGGAWAAFWQDRASLAAHFDSWDDFSTYKWSIATFNWFKGGVIAVAHTFPAPAAATGAVGLFLTGHLGTAMMFSGLAVGFVVAAPPRRFAQSKRVRRGALLLALSLLGASSVGCAGRLTPKAEIERADRVAFEALRAFQKVERQAFEARLAWPTPEQHRAINQKLAAAYQLVIDLASAGILLKPGSAMPADVDAGLTLLSRTVADLAGLVSPSASEEARTRIEVVSRRVEELAAAIGRGVRAGG